MSRSRLRRGLVDALGMPVLLLVLGLASQPAAPVDAAPAWRDPAAPAMPPAVAAILRLAPLRAAPTGAPIRRPQSVLPQPASNTATPRIQLPTPRLTAGAPATLDPDATPTLLRAVVTPSGPRATAPDPPGANPGPETPTAPAPRPGDRETAVAATLEPGAAPEAASGAGAASVPTRAPADPDRPRQRLRDAAERAAPAPRGFIGPAPEDPGLRRIWEAQGSPRSGQSLDQRLIAGRPGPWRFSAFYLLLALLLIAAAARAWRSLRQAIRPSGGA